MCCRDRKKKKFVRESGRDEGKKKVKTESGTWISASYKSNLYPCTVNVDTVDVDEQKQCYSSTNDHQSTC